MPPLGDGAQRSRYVHVVSAAFSNPPASSPSRALRRYDPRAPAGPTLLRDMERACRNALVQLDGLPQGDASPVTHLFGITLPDRDFSVNALHGFYDFKSILSLGDRCQLRFEVGSSDAGAVLFATAVRLLRGVDGPATALVVAGQEIAPDARRNVRDFVGQVITSEERAIGLNMIPLGDMVMDAIVHRARVGAGALAPRYRDDAVRSLISQWTRRKLRLGASYAPSHRDPPSPDAWNRAQGRWLGSQDMAAASVGACAVVLSTDPEVIARAPGTRHVRVLGVGEGDARPAVTERNEPLIFFKAMRQAFSALRRATGTNLDFLRASGFAVLHDAFPSIELALLAAMGFSPTDGAQRASGWWPNPRGGLVASGHAFAASGLVQVAHALHTFGGASAFEANTAAPEITRLAASPLPIHCVTASVGGPLSHVVATLLQSTPRDDASALARTFAPPPRHRAEPGDDEGFEEKATWVAAMAGFYRDALARHGNEGGPLGVLEARSKLRLDALVAASLPLPFTRREAWSAPTRVRYRGQDWPIPGRVADAVYALLTASPSAPSIAPRDGAADAPRRVFVSDEDVALRQALEGIVSAAAEAMIASRTGTDGDPRARPAELRDELYVALGVPVGFVATDARSRNPHALVLISIEDRDVDTLPIGSVLALGGSTGPMPAAVRLLARREGLVPPWLLSPHGADECVEGYEALLPRIDALLAALRAAPWSRASLSALRQLAADACGVATSRPDCAPPGGLVALMHALVLDPDEDRDAIALALSRLQRAIAPERDRPQTAAPDLSRAIAATVLVDIVGASGRTLAASLGQLNVVSRAIRRAEAWLAGARVEHARIADAFCLTAWLPREAELTDATTWRALLTYARDVYQHCLDHDVSARILVTAGRALPFREIDATALGAVSASGFALESVLSRCLGRAFDENFEASRRDGVVLVIADEVASRCGAATAASGAESALDALWELEGERLTAVRHRGAQTQFAGACGVLEAPDARYLYQLRQRARSLGAERS